MAIRLAGLRLTAEYRGTQPGGDFKDRETGEKVEYGPKLKFEVEDPETGDVTLLPLRGRDFDQVQGGFDYEKLKKGDTVDLEVTVVLGASERERSYLQVTHAAVQPKGALSAA